MFEIIGYVFVYIRINTDMMSLIIYNLQLDFSMKIISELSKIDRFDTSWSNIEKKEGSTLKQYFLKNT
jgi:hypothetical protein